MARWGEPRGLGVEVVACLVLWHLQFLFCEGNQRDSREFKHFACDSLQGLSVPWRWQWVSQAILFQARSSTEIQSSYRFLHELIQADSPEFMHDRSCEDNRETELQASEAIREESREIV